MPLAFLQVTTPPEGVQRSRQGQGSPRRPHRTTQPASTGSSTWWQSCSSAACAWLPAGPAALFGQHQAAPGSPHTAPRPSAAAAAAPSKPSCRQGPGKHQQPFFNTSSRSIQHVRSLTQLSEPLQRSGSLRQTHLPVSADGYLMHVSKAIIIIMEHLPLCSVSARPCDTICRLCL